ncbi:MAG: ABC transporter substrate-binding protein [Chloroflexi bacterium]|nr:ABC transporter substrate-binding protein [Chloroflexota bacterium]
MKSKLFSLGTLLVVMAVIITACAPAAPAATEAPAAPAATAAPAAPAATTAPAAPAATAEPAKPAPITITFMSGLGAPDNVPMAALVKQFNAENTDGITVEQTEMDWATLYSKLVLDFKGGTAPDVVTLHQTNLAQNVSLGVLQPIDAIYPQVGIDPTDFIQSAWQGTMVEGKQYAIPNDMHPLALFYNTDLFIAAGLDPNKPPKTGAELLDYAQKLTNPAKKQYGIGLGYTAGGPYRIWMSLLWQHKGQELLTPDNTKAAFNTPAGIESLQFMYDLVYKYKVNPPAEQDEDTDFKNGTIAMIIEGPWEMGDFNPVEGLHYKTAQIPVVFDQPAGWADSHVYAFPDNKKPEATLAGMKFAKWMSDHNFDWTKNSGHQPVRLSVANSPEFKALENWQAFSASVPVAHYYPAVPKEAEAFGRQPNSPFTTMMESVMLDKVSVADAIANAEKAVNDILAAP